MNRAATERRAVRRGHSFYTSESSVVPLQSGYISRLNQVFVATVHVGLQAIPGIKGGWKGLDVQLER